MMVLLTTHYKELESWAANIKEYSILLSYDNHKGIPPCGKLSITVQNRQP